MEKIYLLLIVAVLFSCNTANKNAKTDDYETINLNGMFRENSGIEMADLIDSLRIIKLETTEESIVGNISKIMLSTNGNYIIGDDVQGKGIIIFDKNGKFIKRISNGNGSGELRYYTDFDFDYKKAVLLVGQEDYIMKFDENGNYLGDYDAETGQKIKVNFHYSDFKISDDGFIFKTLVTQNNGNALSEKYMAITDKNCNVQKIAITKFAKFNYSSSNFDYSGRCFSIPLSDTIYNYAMGKIRPKYVLDYSDCKEDYDYTNIPDFTQFMAKMMKSKNYFFDGNYQETENTQFFLMMRFQSAPMFIFRNKQTKQIHCGDFLFFNHKLVPSFSLPISTTRNGYFVSLIDFSEKNKKLESSNLISETERNYVTDFSEEDNPLIVLFKFKQ